VHYIAVTGWSQTEVEMGSESMYDIFMKLPDGSPLWLEAVQGLDQARSRLASLARSSEGDYFVYSEKSGGIIERASTGSASTPPEGVDRSAGLSELSSRVHHR
jgi:hypothetical protein